MMRTKFLLCAALLWCAGCGYQFGFTPRDDVRTLAIPMFDNQSFRRGLEIKLTKLVAQEVQRRTPYRVTSLRAADAVLEGVLVNVDAAVLMEETEAGAAASGFAPDSVLAGDVDVVCRFKLVASDGRVLVGPINEAKKEEHVLSRMETAETALQKSLADLAERIVWYLEGW